ncbi:MAG: peptide deformylase [Dehalococcoidales bacterium]|nr:peptide deformylase [Dehalococcoidales bacterium]
MKTLPISRFPEDPVLRQKAKKVHLINDSIQKLIDNMIVTMQSAHGVGLAAPQVGVSLRVIVLQMPEKQPEVLINPEIVEKSGTQDVTEGCLSVPGYYGEIQRPASVTVKGLDRKGKRVKIKATSLMAEALEHEIDHLNGTLYIDHVENENKLHRIDRSRANSETSDEGNKSL